MGCQSSTTVDETIPKDVQAYFYPIKLGSVALNNRIIMAAMTRCKCDPATGVANDLMAKYYGQRASFGAIITESSQVSPLSNGFPGSAGIYNQEQVAGWKKVTQKVHEKGGKIFLQLYHSGRATMSDAIGGKAPLAPSAIAIRTPHKFTNQPYPVPKEMTKEDIKTVIQEFKVGAQNAKAAGFDGVQVHAANGFLLDQFLKENSNKRTDEYGGSIQNRLKFTLEVIDSVISVLGADKVGVKFSPTGRSNDLYDSNPVELSKQLLKELGKRNLAFVEVKRHGNSDASESADGKVDKFGQTLPAVQMPNFFDTIRSFYSGTLILNDGIDKSTGAQLISSKKGDAVSFANLAIGNPDLPERIKNDWKLVPPDYAKLFASGEIGYTDYPAYSS